ncbi:GNAT family N-acetyltransferase [Cryobacterium melibiosiphilum]|uniref:GNAT family N-acetyltransferase n=1 Tax=Cryobacterium melibiosiphilum TaxID=995039 RepID=A0A3A5MNK3_9MICO|nr:GNAT family N-acetyltransferase [Cryobacterium melibiosiphilum]RJT88493.1 GNAT family N-acetyltransferase [Cryobacterium melibiosiphilum]
MNTTVVVRPVTEADADALGRVHVACWHETYDHLLSQAALSHLRPERLATMWRGITKMGGDYRQVVAVDGEDIVGFAASVPRSDSDVPTARELKIMYLLASHQGTGVGQQLFDAVVDAGPSVLWVAADNPRAHAFYARNGYLADGSEKTEEVLGELLHEVRLVR